MTCAILFARAPVAGQVKTRLQAHLSPERTAVLYEAFLQDCCLMLRGSGAQRKIVASADADGQARLRALLDPAEDGELQFVAQHGQDLGQRMQNALQSAFAAGAQRAVIVGTDAPSLPAATIDDALRHLTTADVVLGPVVDGGYYLVGVTSAAIGSAAPALFENIDWSTGRVLQQSISRLPAELRLALLPLWYDVDHPADATFLRTHLQALARAGDTRAPHTDSVLRGLDLPTPE